ncbi:MAG TPA: helix-turn-helix domain-containing protein [Alphaproteobacteria bacterium]|nr:helix-turn-helix domain-containing protein [Alphaproteobacteria bacterium]
MTAPKRSQAARERLLDTAERLFAEAGIEGASLRQIAALSGQANNSVVQYHFGDKAGLLREIIERRVAGFEPRRRLLLEDAGQRGRLRDIRTLLEILFLPIAELTDDRGRHVYARFMMHFMSSFRYQAKIEHPGWAPDSAATKAALLVAQNLPFLPPAELQKRINWVGGMFFNALLERDNAAEYEEQEPEGLFLNALFSMMTAAISVPPIVRKMPPSQAR